MSTKSKWRFLILITITIAMLCTSLVPMTAMAIIDDNLYQYSFITGQSDCFLISLNDINIMVDTATSSSGASVNAYLDKMGITHLDYLIISHFDSDHIGGIENMLELDGSNPITVGNFVSRRYSTTTLTNMYNKLAVDESNVQYINYLRMINIVAENGGFAAPFVNISTDYVLNNYPAATVTTMYNTLKTDMGTAFNWLFPQQGDSIEYYNVNGNVLSSKFVHKNTTYIGSTDTQTEYAGNINNDSIIFQLSYTSNGSTQRYLYTGDMGTSARTNLLTYDTNNLDFSVVSDVLKVSHHGYQYSTPQSFATAVNPQIAIVTNDNQSEIYNFGYFSSQYETWNARNYVAKANRSHSFVAILLTSYGSSITKSLAYADGSTLGTVPIIY